MKNAWWLVERIFGLLGERAWSLLPDKCEVPRLQHVMLTCSRRGVRGNENRVATTIGWVVMCDDCHAMLRRHEEQTKEDEEWAALGRYVSEVGQARLMRKS